MAFETMAFQAAPIVAQLFSGDLLWLALVFFVIAIVAALVGFGGVAGISMDIAKILVVVFLILAVVALLL